MQVNSRRDAAQAIGCLDPGQWAVRACDACFSRTHGTASKLATDGGYRCR
ncbi:hypothetical protein ABZR86_04395 [Dyella marensis]|nr:MULTISPECIES: hypothetical protein [Dyella]